MQKQKWQQRISFCILFFSLFIPLTGYAATLVQAARDGDIKTVIDLLDKGADVNEQNAYGVTALMAASVNSYTEIARLLLDRGAQVDKQDNNGETALLMVASLYRDDAETVEVNGVGSIFLKILGSNLVLKHRSLSFTIRRPPPRWLSDNPYRLSSDVLQNIDDVL